MNPQKENGYTAIANELVEAFSKIRISGQAMQVLWVIFRKTYGWNKKEDKISLSQFQGMTNLSKVTICKSINHLIKLNIITKKGNANFPFIHIGKDIALTYCIQKDYSKWLSLPKKVTLPKKVKNITNKGNTSLPILDTTIPSTTKDTITKDTYTSIVSLWNTKTKGILPNIIKLTKARIDKLNMRLKEYPDLDWNILIDKILKSEFLCGSGSTGWKASFDWLIHNTENILKIQEGKYDGKTKTNTGTKPKDYKREASEFRDYEEKCRREKASKLENGSLEKNTSPSGS